MTPRGTLLLLCLSCVILCLCTTIGYPDIFLPAYPEYIKLVRAFLVVAITVMLMHAYAYPPVYLTNLDLKFDFMTVSMLIVMLCRSAQLGIALAIGVPDLSFIPTDVINEGLTSLISEVGEAIEDWTSGRYWGLVVLAVVLIFALQ
jgi:hypothetical protein